jgi:hypothetical protein
MEQSILENEKEFVVKPLNLAFHSMKLLEKCIDKQEFLGDEEEIDAVVKNHNKRDIIDTVNNNIILIEKKNIELDLKKDTINLNKEIADIVDMLKRASISIENMLNGNPPIVNYEIVTWSSWDDEEEIETFTPAEMYITDIKKDILRLVKELNLPEILF